MISLLHPKRNNIKINNVVKITGLESMPKEIGSALIEAKETLNNYASFKNKEFDIYDGKSIEKCGLKNFIKIFIYGKEAPKKTCILFKEDKNSQKPMLRQLYEKIQEMCGDELEIEKNKNNTLARLRQIGKIK